MLYSKCKPELRQKTALLTGLLFCFGLLTGCDTVADTVTDTYASLLFTPTVEPTPTRTAWPTFTPTATIDFGELIPSPTATATLVPTEEPTATNTPEPEPTDTPEPTTPKLRVSGAQKVNVRSGPGTNYGRVGSVNEGQEADIVGRNADNSWVFIQFSGGEGWMISQYANIEGDLDQVEVRQASAAPAPAPAPAPPPQNNPAPAPAPAAEQPKYQYTITNVFGQVNEAITQIRGQIKNSGGGTVDGVRVRVRSGSFCTVSYPSGAPGNYPSGNYDILLDNRAKPGNWQVSIVDGPSDPEDTQCSGNFKTFSEEVTVPTDNREGVVFIEWRKNW